MATGYVNVKVKPETRDRLKAGKTEGQTYDDILNVFSNKQDGSTGAAGGKEGVVYLSSAGTEFMATALSVQTLAEMVENPYIATKLHNNSLLYFPSALKVIAKDPNGQPNDEVTNDLTNMLGVLGCALGEKIKKAKTDADTYGMAFFNPVWENVDGTFMLTNLRHLPAWSFYQTPSSGGNNKTYSFLLKGVTLNEDGDVEYYQAQDEGEPIKIDNIMTVKNPQDEGLAGDSKLIELYDIIQMLKFGWNVELQAIARAGAPIFFLKITKPKKATDAGTGGVSDIALGNSIIRGWSTKKQFLLRENMEVIGLPLNQKIDVLGPIEVLEKIIDKYFNVAEQLQKEGSTLGGNALSELKLLNRAIRSLHSWLLPPFEDLVNKYFTLNMFPEGWSCSLSYDVWDADDREIKIKQIDTAMKGGAVDLNDIRIHCGLEPADETKSKSIMEFNKARSSMGFVTTLQAMTGQSTEGDKAPPDKNQEDDDKNKGKKDDDDGQKSGSDKILNKRKRLHTEDEDGLDDLSQALYEDLSNNFDKMIGSLSKTLVSAEG